MIPVNDLGRRVYDIRERLVHAAADVIDSGWYSVGPRLSAFEKAFAQDCGVTDCIGVASGTDALELALRACGAQRGKRVMTVANACGYSTTAILATGAEPVFTDIDPATMLVDTQSLSDAIAADTVAIVVTHLYGRMVNMPAIAEFAQREPRSDGGWRSGGNQRFRHCGQGARTASVRVDREILHHVPRGAE